MKNQSELTQRLKHVDKERNWFDARNKEGNRERKKRIAFTVVVKAPNAFDVGIDVHSYCTEKLYNYIVI